MLLLALSPAKADVVLVGGITDGDLASIDHFALSFSSQRETFQA